MKVFVYGTLLPGMERYHALEKAHCMGPAILQADMYDLGPYPSIQHGQGEVVGAVYTVDSSILAGLDKVESYAVSDPANSLYVRKPITARWLADGSPLTADAYFYQHDLADKPLIEHGDYRRHVLEKTKPEQWVVSYGSNLSRQRLEERVGPVAARREGVLPGYELVFNKQSEADAKANIKWVGGEAACPAIAWLLTAEQVQGLDPFEQGYLRVAAEFSAPTGSMNAQVYIAHPDELEHEPWIAEWYVNHLRVGYEESNYDLEYLEAALPARPL